MSITVFLDRWCPTTASARIRVRVIDNYPVLNTNLPAREACLDAAKQLREAAMRFELLAEESCPYHDHVHHRVNSVDLNSAD